MAKKKRNTKSKQSMAQRADKHLLYQQSVQGVEFELDYVFVLDDQDRARRIRVRTRPVSFRPDLVEIREGVTPGDRVVVSALDQLRVGMPVIVR